MDNNFVKVTLAALALLIFAVGLLAGIAIGLNIMKHKFDIQQEQINKNKATIISINNKIEQNTEECADEIKWFWKKHKNDILESFNDNFKHN